MRDLDGHPELCAINTATLGFQVPIAVAIEAVARHGFRGISPWRREIEGGDLKAIAQRIRDAQLIVPGYCRSSFIPGATAEEFRTHIASNKRAIDDAAVLGAESFVMVVGGLPDGSRDIRSARAQVAEGIGELLAYGKTHGVRIALEPLHPMYAADRSCLSTIPEALRLCERFDEPEWLGLCLDVYHTWWDPDLEANINAAQGRILGFHVCDWLVPTQDMLNDRGMMGDGVIELKRIRSLAEEAGYDGLVEVEVFSAQNWWKRPIDETLRMCRERFAKVC